jgi:hypothetical protein
MFNLLSSHPRHSKTTPIFLNIRNILINTLDIHFISSVQNKFQASKRRLNFTTCVAVSIFQYFYKF